MTAPRTQPNSLRFAVGSVLAVTLLGGCAAGGHSARIDSTGSQAQARAEKGVARSLASAEAAVQSSPRDPALRVALAQAYLQAGRFQSAATTFDDAMKLGDNSARTALSLALADIASGRNSDAVSILDDWRDSIPASDLGLALALAGESSRGVAILADALRSGENTPKLRQNLAYAYALDGRWREARLMASQDLAADKVDARITQWAMNGRPEAVQSRVAALLSVPVTADSGQPQALALNNSPATEQLAAEAGALKPEAPLAAELPPAGQPAEPAVAVADFAPAQPVAAVQADAASPAQTAFEPAAGAPANGFQAAWHPPAKAQTAGPARFAARPVATSGTHLVQLGSFSSAQGARRAWGIYSAHNVALRSYRMTITPAVVRGKNYWRVAAAGFNANSALGMCSSVKAHGGACFAYAANTNRTFVPGPSPMHGIAGWQRAHRR